jgi:hypothetical protein
MAQVPNPLHCRRPWMSLVSTQLGSVVSEEE